MSEENDNRKPEADRQLAPVSLKSKERFRETMNRMKDEANRLTRLVESGKISVPVYKRLMWEHLGISPHCLKEGVSYFIKPEVGTGSSNAGAKTRH